jgi:hypothetical protein
MGSPRGRCRRRLVGWEPLVADQSRGQEIASSEARLPLGGSRPLATSRSRLLYGCRVDAGHTGREGSWRLAIFNTCAILILTAAAAVMFIGLLSGLVIVAAHWNLQRVRRSGSRRELIGGVLRRRDRLVRRGCRVLVLARPLVGSASPPWWGRADSAADVRGPGRNAACQRDARPCRRALPHFHSALQGD